MQSGRQKRIEKQQAYHESIRREDKQRIISQQREQLLQQRERTFELWSLVGQLVTDMPESSPQLQKLLLEEEASFPLVLEKVHEICRRSSSTAKGMCNAMEVVNILLRRCNSSEQVQMITSNSLKKVIEGISSDRQQLGRDLYVEYLQRICK